MKEETEKGHEIPDIFKNMSEWEPERVREIVDDIWDKLVEASGTTEENLNKAISMVCEEGYNGGPAYHEEIQEAYEAEFTFAQGLKFVENALKANISDIKWMDPEAENEVDESDDPVMNRVIESRQIVKSIFSWYYMIYGG